MDKIFTFSLGGVHPEERKEMTEHKAVEKMPAGDTLFVAVNQHLGAPAKAVVKAGDKVLKNQIIAVGEGAVTSIVHSPVSGEVLEIKTMLFPNEVKGEVIVIKNDKKDICVESTNKERAAVKDFAAFIEIIKQSGIIGMGGAGFPTYIKLNPPKDKTCDILVINSAECEPYLSTDNRVMLEKSDEILSGISIILDATGIKQCFIGVENNKMEAYEKLKKENKDSRIFVKLLKTKYPQGAEKQLIFALTGRKVPLRKLPFDIGVIVQNTATVRAIYEAVKFNRPLTERILTVSGKGINEQKNISVVIGTPVSEVIAFCKGMTEDAVYMINGGPMMGKAFSDVNLPVTKTTSGLLFLNKDEASELEENVCIRCGRCLYTCPMGLNPTALKEASDRREYEKMDDVLDCIECGCCSYGCPSNRTLASSIVKGKQKYTKYIKRGK